ncbi:MAG: AAA family ATPase [Planctomycetota bacterium]
MSTAEDPHENTASVAMKIVITVFGGFVTLCSILTTIALYGLSVLLLIGATQILWNLVAGNGKPVDGAVACLMLLLCGLFLYLVRKSADHYLRGSNQAPEDETDPEMPDADAADFDPGEELEMYGFTIFSAPLEELTEEVKKSHDHQAVVELSLNLENYPGSSAALVALGDPEVVDVPLPDDTLKNTLDSAEMPDQWNLFAARVLMRRDPSVTLETAIREYPWVENPQWTQLIIDNRDHLLKKSPFAEELPKLVDLCKGSADPNESVSILSAILNAEEVETLREELRMSELEGIFEVWPEKSAEEKAELRQSSLISTQKDHLHSSVERFSLDHPRSLLITGPSGVGKKTIALALLCQLEDHGWTVLESSAQDLIAGMMFIGQMEERWVKILPELQQPKTILYIPDFAEMEHVGKHMQNPIGLLDRLNNEVRRQRITVLGVLSENDMERMLRSNSALRKFYDVESIPSPAASTAEEILLHEAQRLEGESGISTTAAVAKLMVELSSQFLSFQAPLGGAFDLLKSLVQKKSANKAPAEKIMLTPEDVFEEITRLSTRMRFRHSSVTT